ncbi:MAG: hypothetical protein ACFCGT_21405 [Sandaracinaceae bacterium]
MSAYGPIPLLAAALALLAPIVATPAAGLAQEGGDVALVPFTAENRRAQRVLVQVNRYLPRVLGERVFVIDMDDTEGAAEDLGVSFDDSSAVGDLADELQVVRVVLGQVSRRGRATTIVARVYDREGQQVREESTTFRRPSVAVLERLSDALFPEPPPPAAPVEAAVVPPPDGAVDGAAGEDAAAPPPPTTEEGQRPVWLWLDVGLAGRTRVGSVRLQDGTRLTHKIPFYPELAVRFGIRPLAVTNDKWLSGIQLRFAFHYALSFDVEDPDGQIVGGESLIFGGDAAYLFPIDPAVELGPLIGLTSEAYRVDPTPLFASAEYLRLELRALLRFHIMPRLFVLETEGGYDRALQAGDLATQFGTPFGGDAIYLSAEASGVLPLLPGVGPGVGWVVSLTWRRTSLSFGEEALDPAGSAAGGIEEMVRFLVAVRGALY